MGAREHGAWAHGRMGSWARESAVLCGPSVPFVLCFPTPAARLWAVVLALMLCAGVRRSSGRRAVGEERSQVPQARAHRAASARQRPAGQLLSADADLRRAIP